jgi:hypothetical protein
MFPWSRGTAAAPGYLAIGAGFVLSSIVDIPVGVIIC